MTHKPKWLVAGSQWVTNIVLNILTFTLPSRSSERLSQIGRQFTEDIFKFSSNGGKYFFSQISLAWCLMGDTLLPEAKMAQCIGALGVTHPRCANKPASDLWRGVVKSTRTFHREISMWMVNYNADAVTAIKLSIDLINSVVLFWSHRLRGYFPKRGLEMFNFKHQPSHMYAKRTVQNYNKT